VLLALLIKLGDEDMELFFFIGIIVSIVAAVAAHALSKEKGRSTTLWTLGAFLFPPFILLLFIAPKVTGGNNKTCPFCQEIIKQHAVVCRYCGKDLIKESSASKDIGGDTWSTKKSEQADKYIIKLKASEQLKMFNHIVKEFSKDIGMPIDDAEKALLKGCIWKVTNREEATRLIEKYKTLGCQAFLQSSPQGDE
jgi:hypothetical protein